MEMSAAQVCSPLNAQGSKVLKGGFHYTINRANYLLSPFPVPLLKQGLEAFESRLLLQVGHTRPCVPCPSGQWVPLLFSDAVPCPGPSRNPSLVIPAALSLQGDSSHPFGEEGQAVMSSQKHLP